MTRPERQPGIGLVEWAGVLLVCLCAMLAAGLEALYVPLYAGGTLVPITVVGALVSNAVLPLLARTLVPTLVGVVLPFLAWLVVMIGFGVLVRPEGDVILPGGSVQWVSYAVMLGGALVGTITVVTISPPAGRARTSASHPVGSRR